MKELLEEAVVEQFGERCSDFDSDCLCCRAWQELDNLTNMFAMVATLTLDHDVVNEDEDGDGTAVVFPSDLCVALELVDPQWYEKEYKYGK